jgi:uncharacterized sporulation protein YeaH/YhbH (DUF444 family)
MKYYDLTLNRHKKISDSVNLFRKRLKYLLDKEKIKMVMEKDKKIDSQDTSILIDSNLFDLPFIYKKQKEENLFIVGNEEFTRGDLIEVKKQDGSGSGSGQGGDGNAQDEQQFLFEQFDILQYLFQDWRLPRLEHSDGEMESESASISGLSDSGAITRIHLQRTIKNAMARRISSRDSEEEDKDVLSFSKKAIPFLDDSDIVYKHVVKENKPKTDAVLFCVMDVSGSMEEIHRRISHDVFYYLYNFLRYKYHNDIRIVFISHTQEAWEVDEKEFFKMSGSGGTYAGDAYKLAMKIMDERFSDCKNFYMVHMTDGDVMDDRKVLETVDKLAKKLKLFMMGIAQPKAIPLATYSFVSQGYAASNFLTTFVGSLPNGLIRYFNAREFILPELNKTFTNFENK